MLNITFNLNKIKQSVKDLIMNTTTHTITMKAKNTKTEQVLARIARDPAPIFMLSNEGFGTPNTLRKIMSQLRRQGKVEIKTRAYFGIDKKENVWGVAA